jgi:PKD repeat protein
VKKILLFLVLLIPVSGLHAQISGGGLPLSYSRKNLKSAEIIPALKLQSINIDELIAEDHTIGTPFRYGVVEDADLDLKSGLETQLDSGSIWRYEIYSENAKSIKLFFSRFVIPVGAKLFIYNSDYSLIYGAFSSANMNEDSTFAIADFPGNGVVIEYYEPSDAEFSGELFLYQVSQAYRDLGELMSSEADSGYIDVNCSGGFEWQLEKHAVCLYTFNEGTKSYICSGALINNTKNDGTPYFLTANHCVSSSTVASTVTAYFNYETKGCGLSEKSYKTMSGTSLMTMGSNSDFTLLKFTASPPATYQPYYAGWDLTDSASSTVGIHHPAGLMKKISIDNDPPVTYGYSITWDGSVSSPANTHWDVYFDKGMTAGGSSGSPLFNQDKRIIGQLHGGGSYDAYYGKLNYSWGHCNAGTISSHGGRPTSYSQLREYLAVDSTISSYNGYFPSSNMPEAIFSTSYKYVCVGSPIQITDYSLFNISGWKWVFTPSTITFMDSTTQNSQNPVVRFDEAGTYDIKLVVSNHVGKDSVVYPSVITAGSKIVVSYEANTKTQSCLYNLDSLLISATGAFTYNWELNEGTSFFDLNKLDLSQAVIKLNHASVIDSTVKIGGIIIGTQGTCTDTTNFSFELLLPYNDDIANAKLIEVGQSGYFSNLCASVEENEPVPPVKTCTSQTDWCDEYGTGLNIVENSVWFCFVGPKSGAVSIEANGMDGQIALYEAGSYEDVLKGKYTLLAANDDISSNDPNSKINKITVIPGKMYWIQFDGSGGGTEGEFDIVVNKEISGDTTSVGTISNADKAQVNFYPQPASDYLVVKSNALKDNNDVQVSIYDLSGNLVFSNNLCVQQNRVIVNLESSWRDGIYVVSLTGNNVNATGKFIMKRD